MVTKERMREYQAKYRKSEKRKDCLVRYNCSDKRKAANKRYREKHKEKCRLWTKLWGEKNQDRLKFLRAKWGNKPENKEKRKLWAKTYCDKNKIKRHAKDIVNNAYKAGRLLKLNCSVCGDSKVHGHHEDYTKPLDIIWLCTKCHKRRHMAILKEKEIPVNKEQV